MTYENLCIWLRENQFAPAHAEQLFRKIYQNPHYKRKLDASLPKALRDIGQFFSLEPLPIYKEFQSRYDYTVKFVFQLHDGALVESVLMPEKGRITVCVSSQVGCAQACSFCHTGRMGLVRNLELAEIVSQVSSCNKWIQDNPEWLEKVQLSPDKKIGNVVFMGMGEPLDNVNVVMDAVSILTNPFALQLAPKRVTISTAGHLDGLKTLMRESPGVSLALSLHGTTQLERSRLMPINRRYPINEVLNFLQKQFRQNRKKILIQYTVIKGVNDQLKHARALVAMLHDIPCKINLIPLNPIESSTFSAPDPEYLKEFTDILHAAGIRSLVRFSKGQDIAAACGQLVTQQKKKPGHVRTKA